MRLLLAALALALVAPSAAALPVDERVVRCNTFYCFSVLDEDGDGTPDGVLGGTATFVHEAPTVNFGWHSTGYFAASEATVGEEEDEDALLLTWYVGGDRRTYEGATPLYVEVALQDLAPGGATHAFVALAVVDEDGDGRPDAVATSPALP